MWFDFCDRSFGWKTLVKNQLKFDSVKIGRTAVVIYSSSWWYEANWFRPIDCGRIRYCWKHLERSVRSKILPTSPQVRLDEFQKDWGRDLLVDLMVSWMKVRTELIAVKVYTEESSWLTDWLTDYRLLLSVCLFFLYYY